METIYEASRLKMIVGTRGSKLATTQTMWVIEKLKQQYPFIEFEMKIIKTKGDVDQETTLDKIGDKGVFTSALETALLRKEIDFAVHSMKDMPSQLPRGVCLTSVPIREDARDVLVLREGYTCLDDLPQGARIGTGSKRRAYQLQAYRQDLQMLPIRGNIDTRLRKLEEGEFEAIILAAAGLNRLGLKQYLHYCFPVDQMVPAPCQGILAIETREEHQVVKDMIRVIEDPITMIQCNAERAFMQEINGGCHIPMGAYCTVHGGHLRLKGLLGDEQGKYLLVKELNGPIGSEHQVGIEMARKLRSELKQMIRKEKDKKRGIYNTESYK